MPKQQPSTTVDAGHSYIPGNDKVNICAQNKSKQEQKHTAITINAVKQSLKQQRKLLEQVDHSKNRKKGFQICIQSFANV